MSGKPPAPPAPPGRGARDGIKKDLQRAKDAGEAYDPRGVGNAFTHNFLNQSECQRRRRWQMVPEWVPAHPMW